MHESNPPAKLLGISGSLRRNSHCSSILRTLADMPGKNSTVDTFDLSQVPIYNEDDEGERLPQPVHELRQAVANSEGVILVSPEFNHGIPGMLKNALDWASRPAFKSPFVDKPVLIVTASPAYIGGVRAQAQIAETLAAMLAHIVSTPQVVIGSVHEKVAGGRLTDQASLQFASNAIDALLNAIRLRRLARSVLG